MSDQGDKNRERGERVTVFAKGKRGEMGKLKELMGSDFKKTLAEAKVPVVVDFWAEWCAPCKAIAPLVEALAGEFDGKVKFAKVNVDENGPLAGDCNVMSIPTLIFYKDGVEEARLVGVVPKRDIVKKLEGLLR